MGRYGAKINDQSLKFSRQVRFSRLLHGHFWHAFDLSLSVFPMNIHALELTRLPNVTVHLTLRLAKTLLRDRAQGEQSTPRIDQAAKDLEEQVELASDALIARTLRLSPEVLATELAFDRAVDALWFALERQLEHPRVYAHDGLDYLPAELAEAIDLEGGRARAAEAALLQEQVFGPQRIHDMVKRPMVEQVESTQLVLRNIEQLDLRGRLEALVGARLLDTLEACQKHYELMIDQRLRRQHGQNIDLRVVRQELRWAISEYANAIVSVYRRKQPETGEWVLAKLQPILTLRQTVTRVQTPGELEDALEDFVELELELEQAQDEQVLAESA